MFEHTQFPQTFNPLYQIYVHVIDIIIIISLVLRDKCQVTHKVTNFKTEDEIKCCLVRGYIETQGSVIDEHEAVVDSCLAWENRRK
jgi:hypothetical protein